MLETTSMTEDLTKSVRDFVAAQVLPVDDEFDGDIAAAGGESVRIRLQASARAAGLLTPHGPVEYGGRGLSMTERAPVFEAAGYSLFGPLALNVAAPDEGNIHLLDRIATDSQRERYLKPLTRAEVRSSFVMTEPAPGAGADPDPLLTRTTRASGGWLINGRKHFITGAYGAGLFMVMARTSGEPGDGKGGATMFLAPADRDGIELIRPIPTMDRSMLGGHAEMTFTNVFVPDEDVLGEVDLGFRYAQVRLGPARMTHVMRWTGAARRSHETAVGYSAERSGFGSRLADLGMAQQLIADNEIDLAAVRALLLTACRELDDGVALLACCLVARVLLSACTSSSSSLPRRGRQRPVPSRRRPWTDSAMYRRRAHCRQTSMPRTTTPPTSGSAATLAFQHYIAATYNALSTPGWRVVPRGG